MSTDSLFPTYISPETGDWASAHVTLGARGDSTVEYILKSYLLAGGAADTRAWAEVAGEEEGEGGDRKSVV